MIFYANKYTKLYLAIILLSFCFYSFKSELKEEWKLKKHENGIFVYTRMAENSKFKELKCVVQLKSSLSGLVALINDRESYPHWVYRCGESTILKKISDTEIIHRQTVVAPWPVDSRDFVVNVKLHQDTKTKVITIQSKCIPNYIPHKSNFIRITEFKALWILSPLSNGMVNVEYQLLVNPGGNVPAWLVNLAVIDGPYETTLNMKEWIKKEKYQNNHLPYILEP
ncbi:MAG: START domain-containing protein [Bacteroidia bacterium]|nr:START domain-containing protein [Bacteroidia bacterium]